MATFRKRGNTWRAEVVRQGVRLSATFETKREAMEWSTKTEASIDPNKVIRSDKHVGDVLSRYREEVSTTKRGRVWEERRIDAFCRDNPELVKLPLNLLDASHFCAWRDKRKKEVSDGTLLREMNLFSHVFSIARDEFKWIIENPFKGMRRPEEPKARDRRISEKEIEEFLYVTGYKPDQYPETMTARVGAAFLFAIESAMRAGEIAGLVWNRVSLEKRYVTLQLTKNGDRRNVPLSTKAIEIIKQLKLPRAKGSDSVFQLEGRLLDSLFRKMRKKACIVDLHFHDTRHEAITRLSKKMDVLDLARMVGIRDLKTLMVYYNATAEEIAGRLD